MTDASLIAADAGPNVVTSIGGNLIDEIRIGDQCASHANHIGLVRSQDF
tara:strand:- start:28 stop:174 length:147 start_codon:yes stop_codon:yes gene_type:complete